LTLAASLFLGVAGSAIAQTPNEGSSATQGFEELKALAGRWEATTPMGKVSVTYEVVSQGHAVVERQQMAAGHEMVTVYHLDGDRLVLTHYCDTGSQPRMQAAGLDPKTNTIHFEFRDVTNLPSPDASHMHELVVGFRRPDEVSEDWTSYKDGKAAHTVAVVYHRAN
jgi:hypothetical protein